MTARTWMLSDLESVAKRGVVCLPHVLLNRIAREAAEVFGAPRNSIATDLEPPTSSSDGGVVLKAKLIFGSIKWPSGTPAVALKIEQRGDDQFRVRVGGDEGSKVSGHTYEFNWIEQTPPELFSALFACAVECVAGKAVK